jgi:hypothetical protein
MLINAAQKKRPAPHHVRGGDNGWQDSLTVQTFNWLKRRRDSCPPFMQVVQHTN